MKKPRILVDENVPQAAHYFGRLGEVVRFPGRELQAAQLRGAEALIVRSVTRVDAALLAASQVNFVGTCTIGTDHLDTEWLAKRGVAFANAPGCNANSVVEYVLTALAKLDANWQGKRVGVVGCGNVGGLLYRRLHALGAEVAGYDPLLPEGAIARPASLEAIFESEIVCLHAPLTTKGDFPSYHMITDALLSRLPKGAVLMSAGRGPVVCNDTLLEFAKRRTDVRLVLDVWEHEPWLNPELLACAAIGTPHIAGYSYDGKVLGTQMIYEALAAHWQQPCTYAEIPKQHTNAAAAASAIQPRCAQPPLLTESDWQQVRGVMCGAYDLAGDDSRLRDMVRQASLGSDQEADIRKGFDQLRKNYPERREFRFCEVPACNLTENAQAMLIALGFQFDASKH